MQWKEPGVFTHLPFLQYDGSRHSFTSERVTTDITGKEQRSPERKRSGRERGKRGVIKRKREIGERREEKEREAIRSTQVWVRYASI